MDQHVYSRNKKAQASNNVIKLVIGDYCNWAQFQSHVWHFNLSEMTLTNLLITLQYIVFSGYTDTKNEKSYNEGSEEKINCIYF